MIHTHVFPKSYLANNLSVKRNAKGYKSYSFLNVSILSVFRFFVLFFTTGMGLASMAMLGASLDAAMAQMPITTDGAQTGVRTMSQVNVLFVNPSVGDDRVGHGGEGAPFKTITQALQVAAPNTVIMLSSGTYSAETGENFPLMLKPNVSLQGDARSKGRGIVIQGGGAYLSRTFGGQNVTVVGATQARLTGVTITNPNPRGYGLWIEHSHPIVVENTFTGNTQDGIAVTGNSEPIIRNNFFYQNKANGITISGSSRPEVRENVFQQTGFGINITQNAQPIVVGNSVQYNRSGIVVQANARPILRNNVIQGSKEDGLVVISQAMPNLGIASAPGGNEFRNNARYDINASTAKQIFPAFGNNLTNNRINGRVDVIGTTAVADVPGEGRGGEDLGMRRRADLPASSVATSSSNAPRQLNNQLQPLVSANSPFSATTINPTTINQKQPSLRNPSLPNPNSLTRYDGQSVTRTVTSRQVAPTANSIQPVANTPNTSRQANYVRISSDTIEFTAPQAAGNTVEMKAQGRAEAVNLQQMSVRSPLPMSVRQLPQPNSTTYDQIAPASVQRARSREQSSLPTLEAAPVGDAALLPVPSSNIPVGNTGNMRKVPVTQSSPTTAYVGRPLQSSAGESPINLRYRVVVEVQNDKEQELVKFLAPGAFRTVWRGRGVMQVGIFSTRYNADSIIKILNNNGLKAVAEPVN